MTRLRPAIAASVALAASLPLIAGASDIGAPVTYADVGSYCPDMPALAADPAPQTFFDYKFGAEPNLAFTARTAERVNTVVENAFRGITLDPNSGGADVILSWKIGDRLVGESWPGLDTEHGFAQEPALEFGKRAGNFLLDNQAMVATGVWARDAALDRQATTALTWMNEVSMAEDSLGVAALDSWLVSHNVGALPDMVLADRIALDKFAYPALLGCEDLFKAPFGALPGDNPEVQMTGGTEGGGDGAARVQVVLASAYGGGTGIADVQVAGGVGPAPSCARIGWDTIDACFAPAVGLLSARVVGNVGCSGTIVGPHHVLTAAHCVCVVGSSTVVPPGGIVIGTHAGLPNLAYYPSPSFGEKVLILNPTASAARASVRVQVDRVQVFGDFCINRLPENDLALVTVSPQTPFPAYLHARLAAAPPAGTKINIVGFGRDLHDARSGAGEVMNVKRYLSAFYVGTVGGLLAVRGEHGDSCQNDSGSGAYLRHADGTLLVFGVLSRGDRACFGAADATYVDLSNPRYDTLLGALRPSPTILVAYQPADDSGNCIGDLCENQAWTRRP